MSLFKYLAFQLPSELPKIYKIKYISSDMAFRSPLDIGGFIGSLDRRNDANARCGVCGRDRRLKGRISANTKVTRMCPECREPLNWTTLGDSGQRVEYEWSVKSQRPVKIKNSEGKSVRISFD
mgnify:CR=1 FL=1